MTERSDVRLHEAPPNEVGLLISILSRYPEVGSLRFSPQTAALEFVFLASGEPDDGTARSFERRLKASLDAFGLLSGYPPHTVEFRQSGAEGLAALEIVRDIETLSAEEIALLVALVQEAFGERLVREPGELPEEELRAHEEMIAHLLDDLRERGGDQRLIGYREEGRVYVYHREDGPRRSAAGRKT